MTVDLPALDEKGLAAAAREHRARELLINLSDDREPDSQADVDKIIAAFEDEVADFKASLVCMGVGGAAHAPSSGEAEPVAVIQFARNVPGRENEMPKVISCNWLPDGDYPLYAHPSPSGVNAEVVVADRSIAAALIHLAHIEEEARLVADPVTKNNLTYLAQQARSALQAQAAASGTGEWVPTDTQIKHMVSRFLQWRLPENFNPDGGISFQRDYNLNTPWPSKHEPVGTNLFDAQQAEAMVRHMIEGLPSPTLTEPTEGR